MLMRKYREWGKGRKPIIWTIDCILYLSVSPIQIIKLGRGSLIKLLYTLHVDISSLSISSISHIHVALAYRKKWINQRKKVVYRYSITVVS